MDLTSPFCLTFVNSRPPHPNRTLSLVFDAWPAGKTNGGSRLATYAPRPPRIIAKVIHPATTVMFQ
jgi:hypothetical protein